MASNIRQPDMLIGDTAYGKLAQSGAINLAQAGPHHMAAPIINIAGNTPLVSRNTRQKLLSYPRGFDYLPNGRAMASALQELIEVYPQSVSGITSGLNPDTAGTPTGQSGEEITMYTNMSRELVRPSFTWNELNGYPIKNFWLYYYRMLIADENSKVPGVAAIPGNGLTASDFDATFFTFDVLFYEPDNFFTEASQAWLCTAMAPATAIAEEGSFELNRIGETRTVSMTFNPVTEVGAGVMAMANEHIAQLNRDSLSTSELATLHSGITADVSALEYGLKNDLDSAAVERLS